MMGIPLVDVLVVVFGARRLFEVGHRMEVSFVKPVNFVDSAARNELKVVQTAVTTPSGMLQDISMRYYWLRMVRTKRRQSR